MSMSVNNNSATRFSVPLNQTTESNTKSSNEIITKMTTATTATLSAAAQKSPDQMSAQEYTSTLTLNDVQLKYKDRFLFKNSIRKACRFFPYEPHKHLYIDLYKWSKDIDSVEYIEDSSQIDKICADSDRRIKFASAAEFESTVNRLLPGFLIKKSVGYHVNFSGEDMERACERRNFPYRPKGFPEEYWSDDESYQVEDPDIEEIRMKKSHSTAKPTHQPKDHETNVKIAEETTTKVSTSNSAAISVAANVSEETKTFDFLEDVKKEYKNSTTVNELAKLLIQKLNSIGENLTVVKHSPTIYEILNSENLSEVMFKEFLQFSCRDWSSHHDWRISLISTSSKNKTFQFTHHASSSSPY